MPLVIEIPCPACEKVLKVPESVFGKKIKCKYCGEPIRVDDLDTLEDELDDEEERPKKKSGKPAVKASKPGGAVKPKKEEPKPEPKKEEPAAPAPTYNFADDDEGDGGATPNPLGVVYEGEDIPRCPHCAKELDPPDAEVCIHCGFNNVTRMKADFKKTWAPEFNDWLNHLGPGILALVICIALIVLDVVCLLNMRDWMTDGILQKDEKNAQGEIDFYVKPGAFIAFVFAATIMPIVLMARFGIMRCFVNYMPEEKVKL